MKTSYKISSTDATLLFQDDFDVLEVEEQKQLRLHDLKRAVILSSVPDHETIIEYRDVLGNDCRAKTKVTGVTEYNIILTNQKLIPIHRIKKVVV